MHWNKLLLELKVLKLLIIFGCISTTVVLTIYYLTNNFNDRKFDGTINSNSNSNNSNSIPTLNNYERMLLSPIRIPQFIGGISPEKYNQNSLRSRSIRNKIERLTSNSNSMHINLTKVAKVSTKHVHIFYKIPVNWYKTADSQLENTNPLELTTESAETTTLSSGQRSSFNRPNIVFYPKLGLYNSDNTTISYHFECIRKLGVSVLIITWSPNFPRNIIQILLDYAQEHRLQIAIEIDAYQGRNAFSVRNDLNFFYTEFWYHKGFYKVFSLSKRRYMPLFYIKSIESLSTNEWRKLLGIHGPASIRNSVIDAILIGHISSKKQTSLVRTSNFNGFYSRLASNGGTYTSTWKNWSALKKSADKYRLIFIPTVGPGYNENKKQPKTGGLRRHRTNGQYYGVAWRSALSVSAQFISIASFNDWLAGTQIEETISKTGYKDYTPGTSTKYLDLTRHWVHEYVRSRLTANNRNTLDDFNCYEYFNNTIC